MTALEQPPEVYRSSLNCAVAAAAEWIIYSGCFIFERLTELGTDGKDRERRGEGDECSRVSIGPLFKGKAGLTMERWNFWKQRFGELRKLLDAQVKKKQSKHRWAWKRLSRNASSYLDNVKEVRINHRERKFHSRNPRLTYVFENELYVITGFARRLKNCLSRLPLLSRIDGAGTPDKINLELVIRPTDRQKGSVSLVCLVGLLIHKIG